MQLSSQSEKEKVWCLRRILSNTLADNSENISIFAQDYIMKKSYIMKKVLTIVILGTLLVACVGGKKSGDKAPKLKAADATAGADNAKAQSDVIKERVENYCETAGATAGADNAKAQSDVIKERVENYCEMVQSALENGDAQTFSVVMAQMEEWRAELDSEQQKLADRFMEEWKVKNAERMDRSYEDAIMLNPNVPKPQAQSERAADELEK
jgi:phage host-nuclease inhibitor protein Gam